MTQIDDLKITRIEVINHADNDKPVGRLLTLYKELNDFYTVNISMQDNGRTMKIFLNAQTKENL